MEVVGKSMKRVDAYGKVTGEAKYANDLCPKDALVGRVVHATIANGEVLSIDTSEAEKVPGVVKIVTCFDVPDIQFPTAGHPWSVEVAHQDIADRKLLNQRVRLYGDEIAAIVGKDNVACERAERLLKIEYKEYPVFTEPEDALKPDAAPLHPDLRETNVLVHTSFKPKDFDYDRVKEEAIRKYGKDKVREIEGDYRTPRVSHCHLEPCTSWAFVDVNGKVTVTASTQIPHIMRRVIAQALGWPVGKVRVIKPYIGGGFGNKQDILYEPLNAYLSIQCGGRPVVMDMSREECISQTRVRHAMSAHTKALYTTDGKLLARTVDALANKGAYASHGHAVAAGAMGVYRNLYHDEYGSRADISTVYTNSAPAGAMRAYGVPQAVWFADCQVDDICAREGFDPLKFRMDNCVGAGFRDPGNGITYYSYSLKECMRKGAEYIHWDEKRKAYENQSGPVRHGVGMSIFLYKVGVYPISLETSSARMILNQDGSLQVELGATEIGQGADTVFTQMASETTGISMDRVYIVSTNDTDLAPFDTGSYASRQSFVTGKAVKKCALELRNRILDYASYMLKRPVSELMVHDNNICERIPLEGAPVQTDLSPENGYGYIPDGSKDENGKYKSWMGADMKTWNIDDLPSGRWSILRDTGKILAKPGKVLLSMKDLAETAFYSLDRSEHITAEVTNHCKENTFASGCSFADITVDLQYGKVKIDHLVNVHDSGTLLNPQLAEAQVHGGMGMGIGYGLTEELLYNEKGRPLNNNLLDFKIPTSMDVPDLKAIFLEMDDPMGPYGNKALGEPPIISVAPAIRNAVLNATGVAMNRIPMTQQRLVEAFREAGLI